MFSRKTKKWTQPPIDLSKDRRFKLTIEDDVARRSDVQVERRIIEYLSDPSRVGRRIRLWQMVNELSAKERDELRSLDGPRATRVHQIRARFMRMFWSLKRRGIIIGSRTSRSDLWFLRLKEGWNTPDTV
jgi:hypothetical protein